MSAFATIPEAIEEIRRGRLVIVVDDEDRENEGDLVIAAQAVTPEAINFMTRFGRGLICVPVTADRLEELDLPLMVDVNTSRLGTAFTVSVDSREGTTTGISTFDRATTIKALADPRSRPEDLLRPGHIFPLRAMEGGVLRRAGHTEAAVDLARLAGFAPVGVLCEILADDGHMARLPRLEVFAGEHGLRIISIADLIRYRLKRDPFVRREGETRLPTVHGEFRAVVYENALDGVGHLALVKGEVDDGRPVLVRMHSECLTGEVFGSLRCDCGEQLRGAMEMVQRAGRGVIVYIRQEGRGIGLTNKIKAYALQDRGKDTVGAQILVDLGLSRIRLITNNPQKRAGLEGYGLEVVERIPLEMPPNKENYEYLKTKRHKLGHLRAIE